MKSIQTRLASGLIISLVLVFLLLWIIVSHNIQNLSEHYITTRLEHDIETLLTAVSFDTNNNISIDDRYINPIYKRPFSGHYYLILFKQNHIRSRSLWDQNLSMPVTINDYQTSYQTGPQNQPLILLSSQFRKQSNVFTISIAEDLTPITKAIEEFRYYFSLFSFVILFSLLLLQVLVLKTGLRPLRKIRDDLSRLENGEINKLSSEVPYELDAVVNEINQLSEALHKRLKRSRDALSDLSHAIKKPLTILQQFSDHQTTLDNDARVTLNSQIENIQQLTDRILKRARVAANVKTSIHFNLNQDLDLLIKTMQAMYPEKKVDIEIRLDHNLSINIDREDMLELLGNLLDNAWKWAHHQIIISASLNHQLQLTIEDDGNAENTDSLNKILKRGIRLDETINGYGFGLAIAADIIKDYDGTLQFSRSDKLGGFKAEINLPDNRNGLFSN